MILVPLLTLLPEFQEDTIFPASICIILPICMVSILFAQSDTMVSWSEISPYLLGSLLGGIFAEGIDLPGDALDGVVIVGVGLPQVNLFQETLRAYYERTFGDGFLYAYMLPGMQKVAQAVGRVIRTETDRGVVLLLYFLYIQPL